MLNIIKYTLKRLVISLPVILMMTVAVFFLSNLIPGSPVDALVTTDTTQEERERLTIAMGLDKPVYVQYALWLGRFMRGNLGLSFRTGTPVTQVLSDRLGPTLILTGAAILLMVVLGLTLGILAAVKPYSLWD
jgi:peptide/nickel transport system permease protein